MTRPTSDRPLDRRTFAAAFAAALAGFLIGLPCLNGGFVRDDYLYVATNPQVIDDGYGVSAILGSPFAEHNETPLGLWRPLTTASWRADRLLAGGASDTAVFHIHNLVLNGIAGALVVLLAAAIGLPVLTAGIAGLLFAVHPARAEAVFWISGRSELLMTVFSLLCCFVAQRASSAWKPFGAAICALAAFAAKEQGLAVVFLAAFMPGIARTDRLRILAAIGIALVVAFVYRGYVVGALGPSAAGTQVFPELNDFAQRVPYGLAFLWRYVRLMFWPRALINEYDDPAAPAPAEVALGLVVALCLAAAMLAGLVGRAPRAAFGAVLLAAPLAPVLNVVYRTGETFAERFLCLPLAGAALLLSTAFASRPKIGAALLLVPVLAAGVRAFDRAFDWRSQRTLAEAAVRDAPDVGGSWHMIAADRMDEYGVAEPSPESLSIASEALRKAATLDPHRAPLLQIMARRRFRDGAADPYGVVGRAAFKEALSLLDLAATIDPTLPALQTDRGVALMKLERTAEAEAAYLADLAGGTRRPEPAMDLAAIYDGTERADAARKLRMRALATAEDDAAKRPGDASVWKVVAHFRQALGRTSDAEKALDRGWRVARAPAERVEYAVYLAQARSGLGREQEGLEALSETARSLEAELLTETSAGGRRSRLAALATLDEARGDRAGAESRLKEALLTARGKEAARLSARLKILR